MLSIDPRQSGLDEEEEEELSTCDMFMLMGNGISELFTVMLIQEDVPSLFVCVLTSAVLLLCMYVTPPPQQWP